MPSLALNRLMNDVRPHLPGALDSAIQQVFFGVLDDFCQKSRIWKETVNVKVQSGETEYEIVPSEPGAICALMSLVDENDIPVKCTMEVPGTIILTNEPSADQTFEAQVALTVVDPVSGDYPQFPDWLLNQYLQPLAKGVIGAMMAQPAKPYSNERLAIYNTRIFKDGVARARVESSNKNLHGGQAWRFPQSFAPCRR